uniref:AlNc14C417G11489 protein n=1 Tax=Albugo laibachii Nc14 TaxID=890382 RepID=F0WZ83_9STRA|nr:AlNc14C417G11489 [Albugo laibachii Nc14]|eukprot:CCA26800.1 AlNc14C417G11489 [Albugo laibachii Nc14]
MAHENALNRRERPIAIQIRNTKHLKEIGVAVLLPHKAFNVNDKNHKKWELLLYAFSDTVALTNLETLFVQLCPTKCYLPIDLNIANASDRDSKKLHAITSAHQVETSHVKKHSFSSKDIESNLKHLLGVTSLATYKTELDMDIAIGSLSCLIDSMKLMTEVSVFGCYVLGSCSISSAMQLDGSAIWSLNLLPISGSKQSNGSVLEILNRGKTSIGRRLLEQWIRQPLLQYEAITERQEIVQTFVDNPSLRIELLEESMRAIPDLDRLCTKLERKKKVKIEHLISVYDVSKVVLPQLITTLNTNVQLMATDNVRHLTERYINPLETIQSDLKGYLNLVEEVVDLDTRPTFIINAKHDPELARIREEWDQLTLEIEQEHQKARETIGGDIKCEKDKTRGFVFRIINKKEEARISKLPYVHICQVLVNGVHFTTTKLKALATEYKRVQMEYEKRQAHVLEAAVEVASTYVPVLERTTFLLAELDCLLGFAHAACNAGSGYCRPIMSRDTECIQLINARHPCVELQDDVDFIPNNFDLARNKSHFQIITGPNMGGKSTYIRQLGTIAVMAQVGSFVPADAAQLPIFDKLLVRVGAGDSQQQGVSTFMMEMLEASSILHNATERSLVIIDELGRGTSTYDGFGLAWAISEYLITNTRAMTLFATHFHELTALSDEYPNGTVNRHTSAFAAKENVTMMYQIKKGPCMESFGVHVAELAGFPSDVIKSAKRKSQQLEYAEHTISKTKSLTCKNQRSNEFVQQFAALPMDTMSPQDALQAVKELLS